MGISRIMATPHCRACCAGGQSVCASCARGTGICPEFAKRGCTACRDCSCDALKKNVHYLINGRRLPEDNKKKVTVAEGMGLGPLLEEEEDASIEALAQFIGNKYRKGTSVAFNPRFTGLNNVKPTIFGPGISTIRQRGRSPAPSKPAPAEADAGGSVSANGPSTQDFRRTGVLGGRRSRTNRRTHKKSRKLKRRHTRKNY